MNGIKSFSGKWVEVCEYKDERLKILFESKEVSYLEVLDKGSLAKEGQGILNEKQYLPEVRWRPLKIIHGGDMDKKCDIDISNNNYFPFLVM